MEMVSHDTHVFEDSQTIHGTGIFTYIYNKQMVYLPTFTIKKINQM